MRLWNPNGGLEHTLVFRKNEHVYGSELSGELLGPLSWSASGAYIAAAVSSVVNIWHLPETSGLPECFLEQLPSFVTSLAWPQRGDDGPEGVEALLVGCIPGSTHCISIIGRVKSRMVLEDFSQFNGKLNFFLVD